jgi:YHS domain-containing protein
VLPEEIAVSIIAEIVKKRRGTKPAERAQAQVAAEVPVAAAARDPVCGMTVTVAGAAHRAEHDGKIYYFCCGGCRARFLASPEGYLATDTGAAG